MPKIIYFETVRRGCMLVYVFFSGGTFEKWKFKQDTTSGFWKLGFSFHNLTTSASYP